MNARLQRVVAIVNGLAAAGSLAATLYVGRHNRSYVLLLLFAVWVVSPFVASAWVRRFAHRWPVRAQTLFHLVMPVVALVSLAIYGHSALHPPARPAAVFLIVPLASWLLLATVVAPAVFRSGRTAGNDREGSN